MSLFKSWLECKTYNSRSKYDCSTISSNYIMRNNIISLDNDIDVELNQDNFIDFLKSTVQNNETDETNETNDFIKTYNKDIHIMHKLIETHKIIQNGKIIEKDIFIFPSINRFYTNYLFKLIMSYVYQNNMNINVPIITFIDGKINITTETIPFLTSVLKTKFYNFCFSNSVIKNIHKIKANPIAPPIITKQLMGKCELEKELKNAREIKKKNEDIQNKILFKDINPEQFQKLLETVEFEIDKYQKYIKLIWDNVFNDYLSENNYNRPIMDKQLSNIQKNKIVKNFFESFEVYQRLLKIKYNLDISKNYI